MDRRTDLLTMTDFDQSDGERSVILDGGKKRKLLNWIVHSLEIFMWPEDYQLKQEPEEDPYWRVHIEYCNDDDQDITCYLDYLPDRAEKLHFALLEHFEPDEDEEFDDEIIE